MWFSYAKEFHVRLSQRGMHMKKKQEENIERL